MNNMPNILSAIKAIIENIHSSSVIANQNGVQNRANQMGEALEDFVKNAFSGCLNASDRRTINQKRKTTFSYLGNSTNPPDAMLWNGDAIEIKKLATIGTSQLQLNSSYPKNKLLSNNPKICKACRDCEEWSEKDMLYIIGQVSGTELQNIFFIYGDLYCDTHEVYENVENAIKEGLESLDAVELAETNELGRVNKVDHLEISDLRVRGMWLIKTPFQQFSYLTEEITDYTFKLVALIPKDKYNSFNNVNEFESFCKLNGVEISDEEVPDPQNPANLIDSKLIVFSY
jgi:hypothetical protein